MAKARILVVDDEEDILELIRYNLEKEGYTVACVQTGEAALIQAQSEFMPHLILLDIMLPELDGFEVCKRLKNDPNTSHIPILMLTAKSEEADTVVGLELGADDYITKPFSPRILLARIRTALRRKSKTDQNGTQIVQIHNLSLNSSRFEAHVDGERIDLSATEFAILNYLVRHPGWVFTRAQIIDGVRGDNYPVTDRSVDVQMVGLRKKLKSASQYIETVRGVGYRFTE